MNDRPNKGCPPECACNQERRPIVILDPDESARRNHAYVAHRQSWMAEINLPMGAQIRAPGKNRKLAVSSGVKWKESGNV